ncbi:SGNH/GDSL hydrolase family protein [Pontibacter anaerobius]|uniref:GDSL-type esterase/lipase family protein n=1 Tax=Pontibacter anaerobius TaxID=2993940 RepID=A0ABT3RHA9_9BACT|nr:SGNH/GDSL hydrolase family protein [Pontibacter anaerobius]MCX2741155.1 GDSL-type esterase/lipase family protein [Pontibacter anaerobius]
MFFLLPLRLKSFCILLVLLSFSEAAMAKFSVFSHLPAPEKYVDAPASAIQEGVTASPLAAPQGVRARASLVKAIGISWQPVDGAQNYIIEKSESGVEGSFSTLVTVTGEVHYYREKDLKLSETFYYRIKATANGAESTYSAVVSGTTNPDEIVRIMPLGDSNTDGGSGSGVVPEERIGYRKELYRQLVLDGRVEGYKIDFVGSEQTGQAHQTKFLTENGFELDIDHAGFGGARDEDIADLLQYGEFSFYGSETDYRGPGGGPYLDQFMPDIILLHIGTNYIDPNPGAVQDVKDILNLIDEHEARYGKEVTVVLASIILTAGDDPKLDDFSKSYNANVRAMVEERIALTGDRIVMTDMADAELNYKKDWTEPVGVGDMADNLHPNQAGYDKMAQVWFNALSSPAVPLPVELMSFEAAVSDRNVLLEWVTASERGNSRFEVQRMEEGGSFTMIGTVDGAGDSNTRIVYTFQDHDLPSGILYYRLKQVDHDGAYSYSKVVAVLYRKSLISPVASLYPNLTNGSETVNLSASGFGQAAPVVVSLLNPGGEELFHQTLLAGKNGGLNTRIHLPAKLAQGLYVVQVSSASHTQKLKLIVR